MTISDFLAARVVDLEDRLRRSHARVYDLRRSRDLWRAKYRAASKQTRFCGSCTKRVSRGV